MNHLFIELGIQHLKPLLTALLLPPVPPLLVAAIAVMLIRGRHRTSGTAALLASLSLIWLSCCLGTANLLAPQLLRLPTALSEARIVELKRHAHEAVAIIVLGAGVEEWAPEYRQSSLKYGSLERLRYGIWLGKTTGWPTGFSGGVGWGQQGPLATAAEATVAQRIATEEFGRPLRWVESESRDTHENAANTVRLLTSQGVSHVLVVTSAWHMPRALRNFERAVGETKIRIEAAPTGMASGNELRFLTWIPSGDGLTEMRNIMREWLGTLTDA